MSRIAMFNLVLYEPEIPQNAGNVIRLAANTGARLHLVKPLGFALREKRLERAGLDYRELAAVQVHEDWAACQLHLAGRRVYAVTTRARQRYDQPEYRSGDVFLFGPESRGLPESVLAACAPDHRIRIPMRTTERSLNLSNAVAVVAYEALRQMGFPDAR
jgi:tRNA (cytidine/uridine-2'-O-)-methyltransferase